MTAGGASAPRGWLLRALTEHLPLKGLALLASVVLFIIVRGTENAEVSLPVEVHRVQATGNDQMLVSELPNQVRVTLRGSRAALASVRRTGLRAIEMNLRNAEGQYYHFGPEDLELPTGASVVQIVPPAVPLRWVPRSERRVRVEPMLEGEVAAGHLLAGVTVDPATTLVSGAAPEVGRMAQVRTTPLELHGLAAGRHTRRVPLGIPPDHVQYADTAVTVTVVVDEEVGSRALGELEVAVVGAGEAVPRPAQVTVTVRGPRARIDALAPRRIVPFIDVTDLEPGRGAQPAAVLLRGVPDGLTATVEPSEVLVTLPPR